ncbi:MAG TPA: HAD family hydrolase [Candidatus Sulfomarinibacteraceae bacterium]|nr:HAD family hydrolase [Candidatus Sulfomarinibacteraceae bacterium]
MKIDAILFDLDDTLLGNDMERFLPRYFSLLSEYARPLFADGRQFVKELLFGTRAMISDTDASLTNREVFWRVFAERTGLDEEEAEPFFNRFYDEQFGQLEVVTERRPAALETIRLCFEVGVPVAIATNPLFPRKAIEQRLAWAGTPVSEFAFSLVTSYENMHATKPHKAYYCEILEHVGADPQRSVMVGDSWQNDIAPAASLGMYTFWIAPENAQPPEPDVVSAQGTLDDCLRWVRTFLEGS